MKRYTHRVLLLASLVVIFSTGSKAQLNLRMVPTDDTRADYESFIEANAPSEDAFVAVQRLAYIAIRDSRWDDAKAIFEQYQPKFPDMQDRFQKIIAILDAPEEELTLTNLGTGVNSEKDEYSPTISVDGKQLFFTRNNGEESAEDVMVSDYVDGSWQTATMVGPTIDTKGNESVNGISADGNMMMIFGNYEGSFGGGDLFFAEKDSTGAWGEVQHLPAPINTEYYDADGMFTSDGKAIIFASDRPGCVGEYHPRSAKESFHGDAWGNTDIFVSSNSQMEAGAILSMLAPQ